MTEPLDSNLLAFLRDPASYPHHPRELREIHTHSSLVFVVPPFVYKIKKPVNFGFLDFSSLEKRRHFCQREVELNSRLAPGIYLGVESITRQTSGFSFGGDGPLAEVAVKMRELPAGGFLDELVCNGTAGEPELNRLACVLAEFYQKQPPLPEIASSGNVENLRISTDENFSQTRAFMGKTLSPAAFDAICAFTDQSYRRHGDLFGKRVADGWIRDCHGDLHLDHIHLTDDELHIYDCIEFNDRFRHIDVASDVAFLAMDLDHHGRPDLARFIVRRMIELLGDPEMSVLMDFYKCYRAFVRGKVESIQAAAEPSDATAGLARRYFRLALQYAVCGSHPQALVFMGRVASGKSTLARAVADELGWRRISTDERRKDLAGVPLHLRENEPERRALYAPGMTEQTYHSIIREARETINAGNGIILDATFSNRYLRDRLRDSLGDTHVKWIIAEVDDATARERLRQRDDSPEVVSDARSGDQDFLNAAFEPADELRTKQKLTLKTNGAADEVVRRLLVALAIGT